MSFFGIENVFVILKLNCFSMASYFWVVLILLIEILIFVGEIVLASLNKTNKLLRKNDVLEINHLIDLENGFRTNISVFRFSLFIIYIVLVLLYFNTKSESLFEEIILYLLGGILVYMVSLMNSKIFVFYPSYFIVSSPFNFLRKDIIVNYHSIIDYEIYKALYNSFYLKLILTDSKTGYIHFSGAYLPKNDLVLRYILEKKTTIVKSDDSLTIDS